MMARRTGHTSPHLHPRPQSQPDAVKRGRRGAYRWRQSLEGGESDNDEDGWEDGRLQEFLCAVTRSKSREEAGASAQAGAAVGGGGAVPVTAVVASNSSAG